MANPVRQLPLDELPSALESKWVDHRRRPFVTGEIVYVPVREGYTKTGTLDSRKRYHGRGYHMIGPIAVVRGEKPTPDEVKQIVDFRRPEAVIWVRTHTGIQRLPETEVLYGITREVIHRESGIQFLIDPTQVMFSQGNRTEKMRIAALTCKDERIADMYAGIGYFTLPTAREGALVHAMEINPVAYHYLVKNISLNALSGRVVAEKGDCRTLLKGSYDRVIMGHFDAVLALPEVLTHVHPGSVLHVHSSGQIPRDVREIVRSGGYDFQLTTRKVKKTGPHRWHYVQDVTLI
jgi:tRNA wybutosine-synthesizing protein 2